MISISDLKQLICKIFLVIDSTNEAHCFITLHWIKIQHLSRKWKCWQSNAHQEISRNIYLKTMLDLRETGKPQNIYTAWKVSKYGVFSGPYFPAFGLNTERYCSIFSPNTAKYGPEKIPYLDIFHAVCNYNWIRSFKQGKDGLFVATWWY